MSVPRVAVVDCGGGNLFSVRRALEMAGAEVEFVSTAGEISNAERLVLPGVGAFADGMAALRSHDLIASIQDFSRMGKPFLGICLGMQMLFDLSQEFGEHQGLGLIPGEIQPIPRVGKDGGKNKVPHIGWNSLRATQGCGWRNTPLSRLREGAAVYFVHSFAAHPKESKDFLAECSHGGHSFAAAVMRDNVFGCQFHPEKSGGVGLQILRDWLAQH